MSKNALDIVKDLIKDLGEAGVFDNLTEDQNNKAQIAIGEALKFEHYEKPLDDPGLAPQGARGRYANGVPDETVKEIETIVDAHFEIGQIALGDHKRLDSLLRELSKTGAVDLIAHLLVIGAHIDAKPKDSPDGAVALKFGPFFLVINPCNQDGWQRVDVDLSDPKYAWS